MTCPWCHGEFKSQDMTLVITKANIPILVCEKCAKRAK